MRQNISPDLLAAMLGFRLNNTMNEIARTTARNELDKPEKLNLAEEVESALRLSLQGSKVTTAAGKAAIWSSETGETTIEWLLRDPNISYLSPSEALRFKNVVRNFVNEHQETMSKPLQYRLRTLGDAPSKIMLDSSAVSRNILSFESLVFELRRNILE